VFSYYEFFAGGGMVRAALGSGWTCTFANDFDSMKARVYSENWGDDELTVDDIHDIGTKDLPGRADLAWASFPCQDVSCAGNGMGLGQERAPPKTRSATFWPFVALMRELKQKRRAPKLVVVENVVGLLTTNGGAAFKSVAKALSKLGYRFGAIIIDARYFVPQSRPRVFIVAVAKGVVVPSAIKGSEPKEPWHPESVLKSFRSLPPKVAKNWIWFDLGKAPTLGTKLADVILKDSDSQWHTQRETKRLISLMSDINLEKLRDAKRSGRRQIASLLLRMRPSRRANRQRAEISFSKISGCLRTPRGGGSRPRILVVRGPKVSSRLLSPREAANLMGLRKTFKLPPQYFHAFKVIGDGVAVPAVRFLRNRVLEPIVKATRRSKRRGKIRA
jgi:DNA (cytosine-5)-methyltransferase 1